jgi:hypothetical protein
MQQWEYMVLQVDLQDTGGRVLDSIGPADRHDPQDTVVLGVDDLTQGVGGPLAPALQHFGQQGWELTGIDMSSASCALYILKRSQGPQTRPWWRRLFG